MVCSILELYVYIFFYSDKLPEDMRGALVGFYLFQQKVFQFDTKLRHHMGLLQLPEWDVQQILGFKPKKLDTLMIKTLKTSK